MIREKIIFFSFLLFFVFVLKDAISVVFPSLKEITLSQNLEAIKTNEEGNSEIERLVPPALDRSDWGNDIFYDRSDIYDSWFNLTGITEFSNGRKAIINGEILRLNERVRGFTVKKITDNKVMLKRNQYHVTLNLVQ
ncbi:MAG: hypothetical protein CMG55_02160 [Candidatus Marinimicrobia bacterium]|nr:hypothetical protein [Candidatus Neomarinimicrobiota bacterium]|tara:strand:- start:5287 stop:5697 length:411 start_codon:yes stop_codon:yes gene_type:complete